MSDEKETYSLTGFQFVKDMTKEQLIDEIAAHHRRLMDGMELNTLRANVVSLRVEEYKKRMMDEAGLEPGPMGMYAVKEEDDDD